MKITDAQIIEKVRKGLGTIEDLARDCRITMGCGGCYSLVEKIVKESQLPTKTSGGITGQRPVVVSLRTINQQHGYLRKR
jgi:bacterioferritin-associated ferredoxin